MSQKRPNSIFHPSILPATLLLTCAGISTASGHIFYTGRDFGTLTFGDPASTINSSVSNPFGWAQGTTDTWGDSHNGRFFRFSLAETTSIQISVGQTDSESGFLPAFSVFEGLAHLAPDKPAHDGSALSIASRPEGTIGSFRSLNDWSIGNDPTYVIDGDPTSGIERAAELRYFTYVGHAADGTAANFGDADGIFGDGIADGWVTGTFVDLAPGDYSIFVGGADLFDQSSGIYNFDVTLTAIPEPSTYALAMGAVMLGWLFVRRRSRN